MNTTASTTKTTKAARAHEMDLMRAARQGIDITGLSPDERCKYPGKFCCEKRVRKSTGKLHRFCEYHRSRANVNQKRWTQVRRRHESAQEMVQTTLAECVNDDPWMDLAMPLLAPAVAWPVVTPKYLAFKPLIISTPTKEDATPLAMPMSPTNVDALHDDDIPLSEDDIDTLMTIVAENETSVRSESQTMEDAWLMAMLNEIDVPTVAFSTCEDLAIDVL